MHNKRSGSQVVLLAVAPLLVALCGCGVPTNERDAHTTCALSASGYTYACWLNGWRKHAPDKSPEILAIQASQYDFALNLTDFGKAGFARTPKQTMSYADALSSGTDHVYRLPDAEVVITVEVDGKTYRAVSCAAGSDPDVRRLGSARMWESGRFVQHFEFVELGFRDSNGRPLGCQGSLDLVAWPDSLTLTAALAPDTNRAEGWRDAHVKIELKGQNLACQAEQSYAGRWNATTTNRVTLTYTAQGQVVSDKGLTVQVSSGTNNVIPVAVETGKNCFVASVAKLKRTFTTGYTDIREYDDFLISIDNAETAAQEVPFLLDFRSPANITGLCPILCDREGRPTGIPVQLSKNWHQPTLGAYLMAYSTLPAKTGHTDYILRIAYGFYGTLPSASHAQLSLIGYSGKGGNGRWDQLAIGCWGETICFDMDMSLVNMAVTDVRMLMARNGLQGTKWSWTDAGWGGDWFEMLSADGSKLAFKDLKTAYLSQGPCLTDVRHEGFYGARREVSLKAEVHTLRTDDYARTFQRLRYTFNVQTANTNISFFRQGRTRDFFTPKVAYGNRDGLLAAQDVPMTLKPGQLFIDRLTVQGKGPWWVAFPGAKHTNNRDWGTGSRALVIRSYSATVGGISYTRPTFSMPVNRASKDAVDVDLILVPPRDVTAFQPGDVIDLDIEWITLPRNADDYYGPNETFRKHLSENPASWTTAYREAAGNDLQVTVCGGKVLQRYPIVIRTETAPVEVSFKGGVGYIPIRFEGLDCINDVALLEVVGGKEVKFDQAVHGNDFWQTDYDPAGQCWSLTFNVPAADGGSRTLRLVRKN